MFKKVSIIIVLLVCVSLVLGSVGCQRLENDKKTKKQEGDTEEVFDASSYKKEIVNYELKSSDNKCILALSLAKNLNYQQINSEKDWILNLQNPHNKSQIEIYLYYLKEDDSKIYKETEDFSTKDYFDYAEVSFDSLTGWQVFKKTNAGVSYQAAYYLTKPDDNNKVYAVLVNIKEKNAAGTKDFDVIRFVNSTDYKYLLHSMKLNEITQ